MYIHEAGKEERSGDEIGELPGGVDVGWQRSCCYGLPQT
jgi:hypothetical protein